MDRTPSNERVIPIEIVGGIEDVSDDEIEIDKYVESLNKSQNKSLPPKSDSQNSSSNRASLIITHEDGSTEENECTVTCLGISSEATSDQGLQIEEISQDTLKNKLEDLTVIIPDMSQVIIMEGDEVTDASFVSTPEVEGSSNLTEETVSTENNMDNMKELPPKPTLEHESKIRIQNESIIKNINEDDIEQINNNPVLSVREKEADEIREVELASDVKEVSKSEIDKYGSLSSRENIKIPDNIDSISNQVIDIEHLKPEKKKESCESIRHIDILIDEQERAESQPQREDISLNKDEPKMSISDNDCEACLDLNNDTKEIQVLEIKSVNVGYSEHKEANTADPGVNVEFDCSGQAKCIESVNRHELNLECKSQQISNLDNTDKDQINSNMKNVIEEKVRIIPISLPDGQFIKREILSNEQSNFNEQESKIYVKKDLGSSDESKNSFPTRTIPIMMDNEEVNSISKQETRKDNQEFGLSGEQITANHAANIQKLETIKSCHSIEKLSEKSNMITIKENKKSESRTSLNSTSYSSEQNYSLSDIDVNDEKDNPSKFQAKESPGVLRRELLAKTPESAAGVISNITINTAGDDWENLDKYKQTEATWTANTCSDASNSHLCEDKETESERVRNIPIHLGTNIQGESENIFQNENIIRKQENKENSMHESSSLGYTVGTLKQSSDSGKVIQELLPCNKQELKTEKEKDVNGESNNNIKTIFEKKNGEPAQHTDNTYQIEMGSIEKTKIINIPIQIQVGKKSESQDKQKSEVTGHKNGNTSDEINEEDKEKDFLANNDISRSQLIHGQKDKGKSCDNSSQGITCRKIPIILSDYESEICQDSNRNKNIGSKAANTLERKINIPIQRFDAIRAEDSSVSDKMSPDVSSLTASTTDSNVKRREAYPEIIQKENEFCSKSKANLKPQTIVTVPIQIEISKDCDETPEIKVLENKIIESNLKTSKERLVIPGVSSSSCQNSTQSPPPTIPTSKPPTVVRSIPILRQSLSDSGTGMGRQQTSTRQRTVSDQPNKQDILQQVHKELEEARIKLTAQANSLSSGLENFPKPVYTKSDPRSRSVESEQRNQGARPKEPKQRNLFQRERSLQDIDKDIETIWKELQELDTPNTKEEREGRNYSRNSNRSQTPLSEQVLVTPSWRSPSPLSQTRAVRASISNPNISNTNTVRRTTNPRTIWDEQSVKEQTLDETPPTKLSSSYDSKPKYFPTKSSTHFGFQARPETKPGAITPTYATKRPKSAQSPIRNIPILNEDNFVVNKPGNKDDVVNKDVKSEECEKSCQKSDTSTFTFQPIKTRSQSPINTKFVNKSKIKYKGKESPKTGDKSTEPDPPFEWVDFRKADGKNNIISSEKLKTVNTGEIVKGTILPPLHREEEVVISRDVPIINVLLDDAMKEDTSPIQKLTKLKESNPKVSPQQGRKVDGFNACDAGTQTEKQEKKNGCNLM